MALKSASMRSATPSALAARGGELSDARWHQWHGPHRAAGAACGDGRRARAPTTIRARATGSTSSIVNELKGGAAATAHLLEFDSVHGRWRAPFGVRRTTARSASTTSRSASARRRIPAMCPGATSAATSCSSAPASSSSPISSQAYFDRGVKRVIVAAPVKDGSALNIVVGVNDGLLRSRAAPAADGRVLHDQLPRAGGQGRPRGDRHPPRPDHHDPRSDQHQCRGRCAAQGSAPRALGHAVAAADDNRQRDGDRADLSRAQGQAERPCRARAGAECQPDRLRLRAEAPDDGGRGQRAVHGSRDGTAGRHPRLRGPSAGVGRLLQRHAQLDRRRAEHDGHRRHPAQGLCLVRQRDRLCLPHGRSRQHRHRAGA